MWVDARRRAAGRILVVVLAFAGAIVVLPAQPAFAVTSGPLALGQATEQDPNVLAVDSTAAGAAVVMRTYAVGVGAAVATQRWTFEEITGGGVPAQTYRIRNVAANRCMENVASSATVVIADCQAASKQYWYLPTAFPYPGYEVRSVLNNQCLDLWVSNDGAPVITWACGIYSTQKWRMRYGPYRCDDRAVTALCVRPDGPMFGLMVNFQQWPVTFVQDWTANELTNYTRWETLNNDGSNPGYDYFEVGWTGRQSETTNTTSYQAYWSETGVVEDDLYYRVISLADRPGGSTADGRNHTFIALPKPGQNQWDIRYDYNVVGTTTVSEGRRIGPVDTGVMGLYDEKASLPNAFQNRLQIVDGNDVWRRPRLGETATSEPYTCHAPPTPISWGNPNTPPWCYVPTVATRVVTGNPTQIDYFEVAKPSSLSARSATPAPAPSAAGTPSVHNGVDQRALADCLTTDASRCLQTVPGLAACVRVHSTCNVTAAGTASRATGVKTTVESVRASAARALGLSVDASARVEVSTVDGHPATGVATGDRVLVVTGTQTVTQLHDRPLKAYHGYRLVYHETTGVLLDACLGSACLSGTG